MSSTNNLAKILALDFDGCIAYGEKAKIRSAKELYGIDLSNNQITRDTFPLGPEKYDAMQDVLAWKQIMDFELADGVNDALDRLYVNNHRFVIITSRAETKERPELTACRRFCEHHSLPIDGFYNTAGKSKSELCKQVGAKAIIDDGLSKLLDLQELDLGLYFLSQPWNVHTLDAAKQNPRITIVQTWGDFAEAILYSPK